MIILFVLCYGRMNMIRDAIISLMEDMVILDLRM